MDIKLNECDRMKIWDEITIVECRVRELKGIVQNDIPMTSEVLKQFSKDKEVIINQLNDIENEVAIRAKSAIKDYFNNQWR